MSLRQHFCVANAPPGLCGGRPVKAGRATQQRSLLPPESPSAGQTFDRGRVPLRTHPMPRSIRPPDPPRDMLHRVVVKLVTLGWVCP